MIFPIAFPDPSASFALFEQLSKLCPGVPILLAVHPGEVYRWPGLSVMDCVGMSIATQPAIFFSDADTA